MDEAEERKPRTMEDMAEEANELRILGAAGLQEEKTDTVVQYTTIQYTTV